MIRFSSLVEAIQGAVNQAADAVSRENIKSLLEYFHPIEQSVNQSDGDDHFLSVSDFEKMTPRMVHLQFPKMTANGPIEHLVSVPLLTLSPIPSLQIGDVQVEIDLEILEDNGVLMVGFPKTEKGSTSPEPVINESRKGGSNAKITINIKSHEGTQGSSALIEGYNKVLRAQLPN